MGEGRMIVVLRTVQANGDVCQAGDYDYLLQAHG